MNPIIRACTLLALLLLQGCSVLTITGAPAVTYDLAVLEQTGAEPALLEQHFGHPVETIHYRSTAIGRRDLHEYQVGIRHKALYSLLSGTAAVYTLGLSELSANSAAVQAAAATATLRAYYDPQGRLYGSATYHSNLNMWLPDHLAAPGSFRDGFPCHDFSGPALRYLRATLASGKHDNLLAKIGQCLSLDRIDAPLPPSPGRDLGPEGVSANQKPEAG